VTAIIATAAALYVCGCNISPPGLWRQCCFWLGLLLLYIVLHTGFDYYAEHEFFMHRIQHSVLHHLGPFLIVLSRPGATLMAGLPWEWRQRASAALKWQPLQDLMHIFNQPIIAVSLFCSLILFWLIPRVHFLAMLDWRLYRLMNWSMAVNGLMFWNLALNSPLSTGKRIAITLAIVPPQIAIGMLIFAAPYELYRLYSLCGRAFQLSPLIDQQLGGMVLWISAAMMSVIGALMVMWQEWMRREALSSMPAGVS
jgi:putative membrane protein